MDRSQVTLRLAVGTPAGGSIQGLRIVVNGTPIAQTRGITTASAARDLSLSPGEELRTVEIPMPSEDATITVEAESEAGRGPPARLHLRYGGARESEFVIRPKLYLLAVGIGAYDGMPLTYPAKDATDMAAAFKAQEGKLYREVVTRLIVEREGTQKNIIAGLQWLQREVTAKDVAIIFLAGHGINEARRGDYFFVPYQGLLDDPEGTLVAGSMIHRVLSDLPGKVVLFLDTCHAGKVLSSTLTRGEGDTTAFVRELTSSDNGVVVFAASSGRQTSKESPRWNNGAFTRAVIEGLRGDADRMGTGRVTLNMLDLFISERVKELTSGTQTPTTAKPTTLPDFPLAVSTSTPPPVSVAVAAKATPIYKRWWFWTAIGGVVAAGAITSAVLTTRPSNPLSDLPQDHIWTLTF